MVPWTDWFDKRQLNFIMIFLNWKLSWGCYSNSKRFFEFSITNDYELAFEISKILQIAFINLSNLNRTQNLNIDLTLRITWTLITSTSEYLSKHVVIQSSTYFFLITFHTFFFIVSHDLLWRTPLFNLLLAIAFSHSLRPGVVCVLKFSMKYICISSSSFSVHLSRVLALFIFFDGPALSSSSRKSNSSYKTSARTRFKISFKLSTPPYKLS